jgi:hypothetical protein
MKKAKAKKIIGRREMVDFPELGVYDIDAKIDTGAYTSSIHCKDVKHFTSNEQEFVSFILLDNKHPQFDSDIITLPLYKVKQVKNSFGQSEERFIVKTKISFYDEYYDVELSLADRSLMDYPVLLGRKALKRRFLVDVIKVNCAKKSKSV